MVQAFGKSQMHLDVPTVTKHSDTVDGLKEGKGTSNFDHPSIQKSAYPRDPPVRLLVRSSTNPSVTASSSPSKVFFSRHQIWSSFFHRYFFYFMNLELSCFPLDTFSFFNSHALFFLGLTHKKTNFFFLRLFRSAVWKFWGNDFEGK